MSDIALVKLLLKNKLCIYKLFIKETLARFRPEKKSIIQQYPKVIQFPITYKCNFDCIMCGMRSLITKQDFSLEELDIVLSDKLFSRVESVGVNGGEPFLRNDIVKCIEVMISRLPLLKNINIISNGYYTDNIISKISEIKKLCNPKNIALNLDVSVDAYGELQDYMRGAKNAWTNVNRTIDLIKEEQECLCDHLGVITTITPKNIYNIIEVEEWAKEKKLDVAFNIATVNERINNKYKINNFSFEVDMKAKKLCQEFFYRKFFEEQSPEKSKRYFGIYLLLCYGKRYAPCECQENEWVTLTPDLNVSYCATHSKILGSALEKSSYDIFNENISYLNELKNKYCSNCSHYLYRLNREGLVLYYKECRRIRKL